MTKYRKFIFFMFMSAFMLLASVVPLKAWGNDLCKEVFAETFEGLPLDEITYQLNHVYNERQTVNDVRRSLKADPDFIRDSLLDFKAEWKKVRKPVLTRPAETEKQLLKIGFSFSVAKQIMTYDPTLAIEIVKRSKSKPVKILKVYRGVSIAPENWDPKMGEFAQEGDFHYAIGFAAGSEGTGRNLNNELKSIREEGHRHWGVLIEMEIPDFLYTKEKSTGVFNVTNQAVVASRFGTFFVGKGKPKLQWFELNQIKEVFNINPVYLFKEGLEMTRR